MKRILLTLIPCLLVIGTPCVFGQNNSFLYQSQFVACDSVYSYSIEYKVATELYELTITKSDISTSFIIKHLFDQNLLQKRFQDGVHKFDSTCTIDIAIAATLYLEANMAMNIKLADAPIAGYLSVKNPKAFSANYTSNQRMFYLRYQSALEIMKAQATKCLKIMEADTSTWTQERTDNIGIDTNSIAAATSFWDLDKLPSYDRLDLGMQEAIGKMANEEEKVIRYFIPTKSYKKLRRAERELVDLQVTIAELGKSDSARADSLLQKRIITIQDKLSAKGDEINSLNKKIDLSGKAFSWQKVRLGSLNRKQFHQVLKYLEQPVNDWVSFRVRILPKTQIKFENGLIETIYIRGELKSEDGSYVLDTVVFVNRTPIPFSTLNEISDLQSDSPKNRLYDQKKEYYINLGELIKHYNPKNRNNSFDISPRDEVIDIEKGESEFVLYKDETKNLIQAAVYTDFVGIAEESPNGLVQTEISRKTNLLSARRGKNAIWGGITYINPFVVLSKIEGNNRSLIVSNRVDVSTGSLLLAPHATTISLMQHQYLSAGFSLNIMSMTVPDAKLRLSFNAGLHWGRVALADSILKLENGVILKDGVNQFDVNTFSFTAGELVMRFFPDQRFGLYLKQGITRYQAFTEKFHQVADVDDFTFSNNDGGTEGRNWLLTSEISGYIDFLAFSKVFFRYRFNYQLGHVNSNFHQAQLGFTIDILSSYSSKKK